MLTDPILPAPVMAGIAFIVGSTVGSFLNVCISRWPAEQSVVQPRSRCPKCGQQIGWKDNIPLVSWLILRGRCRTCREPISAQYPAVELTNGLIWAAVFFFWTQPFLALRIAVFATVMLGIAVTDLKHYLIPDGFTVFGLLWCLATVLIGVVIDVNVPFAGLYDALIGACVGAGAIAIAGWLGELSFGKEAMGFGDVTLMAVVGAAVGPGRTLLTVFVGALIASITFLLVVYPIAWLRARKNAQPTQMPLVPFGVFLAPAALVTLLWGRNLVSWYMHTVVGM
jgi:leader peptidase (prepilin peptidase) / N-methyltransferase